MWIEERIIGECCQMGSLKARLMYIVVVVEGGDLRILCLLRASGGATRLPAFLGVRAEDGDPGRPMISHAIRLPVSHQQFHLLLHTSTT